MSRFLPAKGQINVHGTLPRSRANGPGERMVIWLQGCALGCRGCFNPATHAFAPASVMPVSTLLADITSAARELDGVSVSGGEPFAQPQALRDLLRGVKEDTGLSVLVFSGYNLAEIERHPLRARVLPFIDVLVAGRFVEARRVGHGLIGSANQRIHRLSDRYQLADLESVPEAEVQIDAAGKITATGVAPPSLDPTGRG